MARQQQRQQGRGRLSSIDLLPADCDPAIAWADDQLRQRRLPSNVILAEFNERIADVDPTIKPISKSSFNRRAVRKAVRWRKDDETRMVARELALHIDPDDPDELTMLIVEMGKLAIFEILENRDKLTTKQLSEMGLAAKNFTSALKTSGERADRDHKKHEEELKKVTAKVNEIGKKNGVSPDAMEKINRALMGVG